MENKRYNTYRLVIIKVNNYSKDEATVAILFINLTIKYLKLKLINFCSYSEIELPLVVFIASFASELIESPCKVLLKHIQFCLSVEISLHKPRFKLMLLETSTSWELEPSYYSS